MKSAVLLCLLVCPRDLVAKAQPVFGSCRGEGNGRGAKTDAGPFTMLAVARRSLTVSWVDGRARRMFQSPANVACSDIDHALAADLEPAEHTHLWARARRSGRDGAALLAHRELDA